ncbi:hypothetical protein J6590_015774 [Homalodisca vitripennis]|nr:hypothetical protein J6590_015774 [Homalodisca vitripennis]
MCCSVYRAALSFGRPQKRYSSVFIMSGQRVPLHRFHPLPSTCYPPVNHHHHTDMKITTEGLNVIVMVLKAIVTLSLKLRVVWSGSGQDPYKIVRKNRSKYRPECVYRCDCKHHK